MIKIIELYPNCFMRKCKMIIDVPDDEDPEVYIDRYLDAILNDGCIYNREWDFV